MEEYKPLRASIDSYHDGSHGTSVDHDYVSRPKSRSFSLKNLLLAASAILNVFFVLGLFLEGLSIVPRTAPTIKSAFAGLERNIPRPWAILKEAEDPEEEAYTWDVLTNYDRGNIVLKDDYARKMGLPRAQRFPWDSTRGIYLINAYHNLHCVHTVRTALVEARNNVASANQSTPWPHVVHCLHVLRDEVLCNADDTPRYTGFQINGKSGLGQTRMCRDWSQLERWADEHNACWKHVGEIYEPGFSELSRYRHCPEGSPWKEMSETKWLDVEKKPSDEDELLQEKPIW